MPAPVGDLVFGADIFARQLPKSTPQRLLPAFLRYLRDNRCRVVHVVSKAPTSAAVETRRIEKR